MTKLEGTQYFDGTRERRLIVAATPADLPASLAGPGERFVALVVSDFDALSDEALNELSRQLIDQGCVYLCCWGNGCERFHDLFDQQWMNGGFDPQSTDTIMTTWHANESLEGFLRFGLFFTEPSCGFRERCNTTIVIVINDSATAKKIRAVL